MCPEGSRLHHNNALDSNKVRALKLIIVHQQRTRRRSEALSTLLEWNKVH